MTLTQIKKFENQNNISINVYSIEKKEELSILHYTYDASLCMYRFRRDKDYVAWFAEKLRVLAHNVKSILSANVPMEFTRDDLKKFNSATHYHVCEKPFAPDDTRVREHCFFLTGANRRFCAFKLQFKLQRFSLHSRSFS